MAIQRIENEEWIQTINVSKGAERVKDIINENFESLQLVANSIEESTAGQLDSRLTSLEDSITFSNDQFDI